ncbi:hypothetical protein FE257_008173, partial [Aspergillus nanangensis]
MAVDSVSNYSAGAIAFWSLPHGFYLSLDQLTIVPMARTHPAFTKGILQRRDKWEAVETFLNGQMQS